MLCSCRFWGPQRPALGPEAAEGAEAAKRSLASRLLSIWARGTARNSWSEYMPRPPNVPLLRALWSLLDGIWGILKGSWGVLVHREVSKSQWPSISKYWGFYYKDTYNEAMESAICVHGYMYRTGDLPQALRTPQKGHELKQTQPEAPEPSRPRPQP